MWTLTNHFNRLDMRAAVDISLLDSLMKFSCEFQDDELKFLIVNNMTDRYPPTLAKWDDVREVGGYPGMEDFGGPLQDFDFLGFIRTHKLNATEPTVLYNICRQYSLVSAYTVFLS